MGLGRLWRSLALPVDPQRFRTATEWKAEGAGRPPPDRARGSGRPDHRSRAGARALRQAARMMQRFGDWLAGHDLPSPRRTVRSGHRRRARHRRLALGWLAGRRIGAAYRRILVRVDAEHGPLFEGRICVTLISPRRGHAAARHHPLRLALASTCGAGPRLRDRRRRCDAHRRGTARAQPAALDRVERGRPRLRRDPEPCYQASPLAQDTLDRVGVQIGQRRLTLSRCSRIGVTVLLLFAGVRLLNRRARPGGSARCARLRPHAEAALPEARRRSPR